MDYLNRVPDSEPVDKLEAYLTALAEERKRVQELREKVKAEKERALLESNYHQLVGELIHAQSNEQMFYDSIRDIALFREQNGYTLPEEVKVKTFKKVVLGHDIEAMRKWCIGNLPGALLPDFDTLEGAVKLGIVPNEIGYIQEEKRAQVASDLSKYQALDKDARV